MNQIGKCIFALKNTDTKKCRILIILIVLTVINTAVIWGSSMASVEESVDFSGGIMEIVKDIIDPDDNIDPEFLHHIIRKSAHFTEFFILGTLYMLIRNKIEEGTEIHMFFMPLFATLFTAVCDEFLQSFTGRGTSVRDVMLDFSGAVCGIVICGAVYYVLRNKLKNTK